MGRTRRKKGVSRHVRSTIADGLTSSGSQSYAGGVRGVVSRVLGHKALEAARKDMEERVRRTLEGTHLRSDYDMLSLTYVSSQVSMMKLVRA